MGMIGNAFDQDLSYPALSPDERYVLFELGKPPRDIRLLDIERSVTSQFTTDPAHDTVGIWSRTKGKAYFLSRRDGKRDIFSKELGSGGKPVKRVGSPGDDHVGDESPDGKILLYSRENPQGGSDLWYSMPKVPDTEGNHRMGATLGMSW
jgi:Tol biopolymer transport system component